MARKHKTLASDFDRLVTRREVMALLDAYHRVYHGSTEPAKAPDVTVTHSEVGPEVPFAPV